MSFTTLRGAAALRPQLVAHQREFYQTAADEAQQNPGRAYVFGGADDPARTYHMAEVLRRHQIDLYRPQQAITIDNQAFSPDDSYLVPTQQPQYRLIQALFEQRTTFTDSLFYDVSAWTFPLAYNLPFAALTERQFTRGEVVDTLTFPRGELVGGQSDYAYLIEPEGYYLHRALYRLLDAGLIVKVATEPLTDASGKTFATGTLLVALGISPSVPADSVHLLMQRIADEDALSVHAAPTGLTGQGIDLGSRNFRRVRKPEVALLVGGGVSSYDAGEVWHLLDQRFAMPLTLLDVNRLDRTDLSRYTTLVMVDGNYGAIDKSAQGKLKRWLTAGNTLVAQQGAGKWLSDHDLGGVKYKKMEADSVPPRPYALRDTYRGAQVIGGAIFATDVDLTHPVAYGLTRERLPVFRNEDAMIERGRNPYAYPVVYTDTPLLAGYISDRKKEALRNTAAVAVTKNGKGTIIVFADNPNFRAYWYGTNKLFMNSLFYGQIVE